MVSFPWIDRFTLCRPEVEDTEDEVTRVVWCSKG